ncbi:MAG: molybdopterin cofactor-binding domain-containing protein [Oligoflexus sp.]
MSQWISNRRELIKSSMTGAAGLCFAFSIPWEGKKRRAFADTTIDSAAMLHAFIKIYEDDQVEIAVVKAEMGQGVATSLSMIICEELDADWQKVHVRLEGELPPYYDPQTGGLAATFGSTSVRTQYQRLRVIGAAVKQNLLQAAAEILSSSVSDLRARDSQVFDASGKARLSYGQLARLAVNYPLPENPPLKDPGEFKLIGSRILRKDTEEKIEGSAVFGIDVVLPDLHYAAIKHHPSFGSKLLNFAALQNQVPQNYQLIEALGAIILVGPSYWQAQQILNRLPTDYELPTSVASKDQAQIESQLASAVEKIAGTEVFSKGSLTTIEEECDSFVEAEYFVPFLAHGAMEPMSCAAIVQDDRCEFWIPTQSAQLAAFAISQAINRPLDQIKINVTYLGGAFGRKVETDFVVQAALAAKASGKAVKLIWSRSEDTQHDFYRPAFQARLRAGFQDKRLLTWSGKNAGPSINRRANPATKIDFMSIEGFSEIPYAINHQKIFHEEVDLGLPVGYWRSVGKSQNTFFVESFIDELAHHMERDPLELRIELLDGHTRSQKLLQELADFCRWYDRPESMGLAFMEGFGSIAALASEVNVIDGKVKVENIWCVVDCGQVVNLDGAEAQIQGGAIFGLAAALTGKITVSQGRVEQRIFGDMPYLRLRDCPRMHVKVIASGEAMGGLGEVATPLPAPAVCNAIYKKTGQRIRRLPINDFRFA